MLLYDFLKNFKKSKYFNSKDAGFVEGDHPRGQPGNAGQFAPKGGGVKSSKQSSEKIEERKGGGKLLLAMKESIAAGETEEQILEKFTKLFKEKGQADPDFIKKRIAFYKKMVKKFYGGEKPKPKPDKPEPEKPKPEPDKPEPDKPGPEKKSGKRKGSEIREEFLKKSKELQEQLNPFIEQKRSLWRKMQDISSELWRKWNDEGKPESWRSALQEHEEYQELKKQEQEADAKTEELQKKKNNVIYDLLRQPEENRHSNISIDIGKDSKDKKWAKESVDKIIPLIHKDAFSRVSYTAGREVSPVYRLMIDITLKGKGYRAHFTPNTYKDSDFIGKIVMGARNQDTFFHEFGHQIEHTNIAARRACRDFLNRRTEEERMAALSVVTGNKGYSSHEMTKKDKFFSAYVGKIYQSGDTEVLSMGLEKMMTGPHDFAKTDPEHFDLICDIIQGNYKPKEKMK